MAWIVPGHCDPADPFEAKARLEMDRCYLEALYALQIQDFSEGIESQARSFLQRIGEPRADGSGSWKIHLQNLQAAYRWLPSR